MYLTSVKLNPSRRETRKFLGSAQALHAAVLCGFPPGGAPQGPDGERVLWRLDRVHSHELTLWVSSPTRPDYRGLVEQASWPESAEAWRTADTSPFLGRLAPGQQWQFRVTVNPTLSRKVEGLDRGRVVPLTAAGQTTWLVDRAARHGFEIVQNQLGEPALTMRERRTLQFERRTDGRARRVTVSTACFDGMLTVVDPVPLRQMLKSGLGRAKGYGCGLMTLAPPR